MCVLCIIFRTLNLPIVIIGIKKFSGVDNISSKVEALTTLMKGIKPMAVLLITKIDTKSLYIMMRRLKGITMV